MGKGKLFKERLLELIADGRPIVLAGLILFSSAVPTIVSAQAQQLSNDEEVDLVDTINLTQKTTTDYSTKKSSISYYDVFSDQEVNARAEEFLNTIDPLVKTVKFTKEEIASNIMILGGRNPFNRDIQDADVIFALDRLNRIMDAESLLVAAKFKGFGDGSSTKVIVPYSSLLPDDSHGKKHTDIIQTMRAKMLLSNTPEEAYPVVQTFMSFIYNYYFANGMGVTPGWDEAERSGYRLLNIALVLNTANLAISIAPNAHYQFEVKGDDGKVEYCDWDLPFMINQLLTTSCQSNACVDDYEAKVNYLTDAILGTKAQAVKPLSLK